MRLHQAMLLALLGLLASAGGVQKKAPRTCPWCHDDPVLLKAAGLVSHGPLEIGPAGSEAFRKAHPGGDWIFLESTHIRWASSLGPQNVKMKDQKHFLAELEKLRQVLPDVPEKVKRLDPWLRLHLHAMRGEEVYARFQELLQVTDEDFPDAPTSEPPFMGYGKYLGEMEKFEILLHASRGTHREYTQDNMGATVTDSLRWHFSPAHKMVASIPAVDSDLRNDRYLFPHVAHCLSHLFLCAYKNFSYDPPFWLDAGLAHFIEIEVEPRSHTREGEEGSMPDGRDSSDWSKDLRKLAQRKKLTSLASLLQKQSFIQLEHDDHVTCWGIVTWLIEKHPLKFAAFVGGVKGQLDEQGIPTGKDLPGLQRRLIKELFGLSVLELDEAFREWVGAR